MLHGDSQGLLNQRHLESWTALGRRLQAPDRNVFLLIRPGYQSPAGTSSGWANPVDDDYTTQNMERVAGVLRKLCKSPPNLC